MPTRAKLPPGEGKRVPLNMRTTRGLREKLEKNAADSGRSLAQEVEYRLEQSFLQEDAKQREQRSIQQAFGGPVRYQFLRMISAAADRIEWIKGKRVDQSPSAWLAFQAAATGLFDEFAPARLKRPLGLLDIAASEDAKALGRDIAELGVLNIKIAICRQKLKKTGVDPDSIDLTGSE